MNSLNRFDLLAYLSLPAILCSHSYAAESKPSTVSDDQTVLAVDFILTDVGITPAPIIVS